MLLQPETLVMLLLLLLLAAENAAAARSGLPVFDAADVVAGRSMSALERSAHPPDSALVMQLKQPQCRENCAEKVGTLYIQTIMIYANLWVCCLCGVGVQYEREVKKRYRSNNTLPPPLPPPKTHYYIG